MTLCDQPTRSLTHLHTHAPTHSVPTYDRRITYTIPTVHSQEFVCLVDECDLLSHREAIIKRGAALKNERKPAFLQVRVT